jgi:hypothetical protein
VSPLLAIPGAFVLGFAAAIVGGFAGLLRAGANEERDRLAEAEVDRGDR